MLTTGVRTPVGIKILGDDLNKIQELGQHIEMVIKNVPGTTSVFAERTAGGYFLDFALKREKLARYGFTVGQAEMAIMSAVGGENITMTVEGRERYPVNVRYLRDYRNTVERLSRVLVPTMNGAQIPITQIADIKLVDGPSMIRDENGRLSGYVYVDVSGRDIGSYVKEAKKAVSENVKLPPGHTLVWSGQYEYMQRAVGTGVVIIDNGTVLTSLHVVAGASRVQVLFAEGLESEATVLVAQPENDLAVLRAQTLPDDLVAAIAWIAEHYWVGRRRRSGNRSTRRPIRSVVLCSGPTASASTRIERSRAAVVCAKPWISGSSARRSQASTTTCS